MALDFYDIADINLKRKLFEISLKDWTELNEILVEFYKATGLRIDEYGANRIYASHVRLIVSNIETYLDDTKTLSSTRIKLKRIVKVFLDVKDGFLIVGD